MMKNIYFTLIALVAIALTSCKAESCPPLYTTLTLELTFDQPSTINTLGETPDFPVKKLELFTLQTYGNVVTKYDVDLSESVPVIDKNRYHFTATVKVPFGEYSKMWIWGNVNNPMVYMPNRQSIRMFNNVVADRYMLLTSRTLSCNALQQTLQGELKVLTAQVKLTSNLPSTKIGTQLLISNIYDRVDIEGAYSNSGALDYVLQFDLPTTTHIPPPQVYLFPQPETASQVEFTLSCKDDNNVTYNFTSSSELKSLDAVEIKFSEPLP